MIEFSESMKWAIGQFIVILVFLYNESRKVKGQIDAKVDLKVDKLAFEKEQARWKDDVAQMRAEHSETAKRLEKQSDEKIKIMFDQVKDSISNTEKHLSEKLEMMMKMLKDRD